MLGLQRFDLKPAHQRVQQGGEHRFPDPAESQAGQRDSQLRGAQRFIQVMKDAPGNLRAHLAFQNEMLQLGVADLHQRKFGGNKKSVQQHQQQHRHDFQPDRNGCVPVHVTGSPRRRPL